MKELIAILRDLPLAEPETMQAHQEVVPSFAQSRMWLLNETAPHQAAYNLPYIYKVSHSFNLPAFREALKRVISQHSVLRTCFVRDGDRLLGRVCEATDWDLEIVSGDPREVVSRESRKPFRLDRDLPIRGTVVTLDEGFVIVLVIHHIAFDGASVKAFWTDLAQKYSLIISGGAEPVVPRKGLGYAEYAAWYSRLTEDKRFERILQQYHDSLSVCDQELQLGNSFRPTEAEEAQSETGSWSRFAIENEQLDRVRLCAKEQGVQTHAFFLACAAVFLGRWSGQTKFTIGTTASGRIVPQLKDMIGLFVNSVVLPVELDLSDSFDAVLSRMELLRQRSQTWQLVPFEMLVAKMNPVRVEGRNPLFDVLFNYQSRQASRMTLLDVDVEQVKGGGRAALFDLEFSIDDVGSSIVCHLGSATLKRETLERMSAAFQKVIGAAVEEPRSNVFNLTLLTEAERSMVLAPCAKPIHARGKTVLDLFEAQARDAPDRVAVEFEGERLTYRELDLRANHVGWLLKERHGVAPETCVGLLVERSVEMMVGILGILKAGGAYVPIEPDYPADRMGYIVADSDARVVLSHKHHLERVPEGCSKIDLGSELAVGMTELRPDRDLGPESLIYVLYTSGSTGKPKGVMVEHEHVVNILVYLQEQFPVGADDAYLLKTPYTFDVSVSELFGAFVGGGRLVILPQEDGKDGLALLRRIEDSKVTHINFVPSLLLTLLSFPQEALRRSMNNVKYVMVAGEAFPEEVFRQWRSCGLGADLENLYGPTEATIYVTRYSLAEYNGQGAVPIGKPVANVHAYVLGANLQPQPFGAPGELCFGGAQVARGYKGLPGLTAERFVDDPFRLGSRMYKTGDLAKWTPDGQLEYLGRMDDQVKVRGHRIELGEVEGALLGLEGVVNAAACVHSLGGDQVLCGYLVMSPGNLHDEGVLRQQLASVLPGHMIPTHLARLDNMPLTASGKINRRVLSALPLESAAKKKLVVSERAPTTVESELAAIWKDVLKVESVGLEDDFFDIGGHSLLAIRVAFGIQKRFAIEVRMHVFFRYPVLASMAGQIELMLYKRSLENVRAGSDLEFEEIAI